MRRQISGISATLILVLVMISPLLAFIISTVGSFESAYNVVLGIFQKDAERLSTLFNSIEAQAESFKKLYPGLPFAPDDLRATLERFLTEATNFGPNFLSFLFKGTGSLVAQLVLCFLILPNCYAQGGLAARFILRYTPLNTHQVDTLVKRHRGVVLRLLNDTIATAIARGIALGGLAWICTGLPFLPIAFVAAFISLVPVIGSTMVWLPLVLLQWAQGEYGWAIALAVGSLASNQLISWGQAKLSMKLDNSGGWLSFLLFIGFVGGLLAFGPKGFIVGPMIVVLAILVCAHLLPYYGLGQDPADSSPSER